jgi:hypothetical protein
MAAFPEPHQRLFFVLEVEVLHLCVEPDHDRYLHRLDGMQGYLEQGRRWRDDANQGRSKSLAVPGQRIRLR